jgi:hypothetical protein
MPTLPAKVAALPGKGASFNDNDLMRLVREVAMDIRTLDDILKSHNVSREAWEELSSNPQFQTRLFSACEEWNSAGNTADRVKIKSLAFIEEALPEFYSRAHSDTETLSSKVEILKTVAKFAGIGGTVDGAITGERLSVVINLGADQTLRIDKEFNARTIEGTTT